MSFLFKKETKDNRTVYTIAGIKLKFKDYKKAYKQIKVSQNKISTSFKSLKEKHISLREKYKSNKENYSNLKEKYLHLKDAYQNIKTENSYNKIPNGIPDSMESFKEYMLKNNMPEKIQKLLNGLDENSINVVNNNLKKILHIPDRRYRELYRVNINEYKKIFETDYEKSDQALVKEHLDTWKEKYKLCQDTYDIEVLLKHHGLKDANPKILNYIAGKDFIDAGAFIGDSVLVLLEYNPNKIYSFEMSNINCEKYVQTMELNNIPKEKYTLIHKGVSDSRTTINIDDSGQNNTNLHTQGNLTVEITDIDSYVFDETHMNHTVGFIKTDLEGFGLNALKGMVKTIQTFRPVLSMAIYHSPEEFFEIKPYLEEITKDINYKMSIERHFPLFNTISGTVLFAYPKELEN